MLYRTTFHAVYKKVCLTLIVKVHPQEYQADMTAILGFVLKHDDSVNDRTEVNQESSQNPKSFPNRGQS